MKTFFHIILSPLRWLAQLLGLLRTLLVNLILIFFLAALFMLTFSNDKVTVRDNTVLVLTLSGQIVEEQKIADPLTGALNSLGRISRLADETLLQDVVDGIRAGAADPRISCLLLDLKDLDQAGLDQLQIIARELLKFRSSGKKVIAAEDYYRQHSYYLAAHADEVYLNPMGLVDLHGFGIYRLHFKEALERLGVNYHIFRVGDYKSAVEPFSRDSVSDQTREQNRTLVHDLWQLYTDDISRERGLQPRTLELYTNHVVAQLAAAGGDPATLAWQTGLIDGLKTRQEISEYLITLSSPDTEQDFSQISLADYLRSDSIPYPEKKRKDSIAIIIAEGPILGGYQPSGAIGADSIGEQIKKARLDPDVKGLVLRINSGGGSAFASELIRQELLTFKKSGKPLVVSMGSVAASGGYWIATPADEIWAAPATLTGSIGIFAAIPTFEESLARLGVYNDGVGSTALSGSTDLTRPINPQLAQALQLTLERGYRRFLEVVAAGRGLEMSQVSQAAEGRVFTAAQARDLGLVDQIGHLDEAVAAAASQAGLTDYSVQTITRSDSMVNSILEMLRENGARMLISQSGWARLQEILSPFKQSLTGLALFDDPQRLYARSELILESR